MKRIYCLLPVCIVAVTVLLSTPACAQPAAATCFGDCNRDGQVTIDELLLIINIVLGTAPFTTCPTLSDSPLVDDVIRTVNSALADCPITYRLTEGSKLGSIQGATGMRVEEPLSGTFTVTRADPRDPNAIFAFSITAVQFQTPSGSVITSKPADDLGCAGSFGVGCLRLRFGRLRMGVFVEINGQAVGLGGTGPLYHGSTEPPFSPPVLTDIQVCGAPDRPFTCEDFSAGTANGYALSVFAVPVD